MIISKIASEYFKKNLHPTIDQPHSALQYLRIDRQMSTEIMDKLVLHLLHYLDLQTI